MKNAWILLALLLAAGSAAAQNTNNDSSCDISVAPAATLLLPYFEVETAARAQTTFMTLTNVSGLPQVAHVTLWSEYGYPALSFNIYLTPYDVQAIDLYDVIVNGILAVGSGPPSSGCENLPTVIPPALLADFRSILTIGLSSTCTGTFTAPRIGPNTGTLATGHATIDVVRTCTTASADTAAYFRDEIAFDNVLIGDFESVDKRNTANFAGGTPMVHIRAVPEGGPAGGPAVPTALPYTFYTRYLDDLAPGFDRRQPLPSAFAARYVQGFSDGFDTRFKIWREGARGRLESCTGYLGTNANTTSPTQQTVGNAFMPVKELVRFDEHENAFTYHPGITVGGPPGVISLPESSRVATSSGTFPVLASPAGDRAGWMYLNLDGGIVNGTPHPEQNWVVVSMVAAPLYSVDFDAAWLGNGCSPSPAVTGFSKEGGTGKIGPSP